MKTFEEYIAREIYLTGCRERAASKSVADRHARRAALEERRKCRKEAATAAVFLLAGMVLGAGT